ncbi:MAG: xanthan lyase [Paludibacter sp.]
MRQIQHIFTIVFLIIFGICQTAYAQKNLEKQISDSLTAIANSYTYLGRINLNTFQVNTKAGNVLVIPNEKMSYMPFRPDNVKRIYNAIRSILPDKYMGYNIICQAENKNIEDLIPNFYRTENVDPRIQFMPAAASQPLVTNSSRPFDIIEGLKNRHIALWQSHGKYYNQKLARWEWQRPRMLETVEDLYTQSFVLPYLVPMLENAGANVLLPRERDTQLHEVIVDNDTNLDNSSRYREHNDRKSWKPGIESGFANTSKFYIRNENPFRSGTYKVVDAVNDDDEISTAEWFPNFPEAGRYAVYVSYKSLENSVSAARYTIIHRGIKTEFLVNQTMNGGTWLYLGHFYFDKGRNNQNKVVLTNQSSEDGKVVTADATKFGGGMGNIARSPNVEVANVQNNNGSSTVTGDSVVYEPETSHDPRYTEGARYWLQWAGVPDSVYSRTQGKNDYSDDFQSRGFWVNYLAGGSAVLPGSKGLNVPVDLAFAFHSDAGVTANDSIIGTLGICSVPNTNGKTVFANGVSRWASRDLTDIIQTEIVNDVRGDFAPEWTRRGLWNKSYSESRVPEVPTMLLELLSHQNFADMRYGLDPRFRFTVSRAIYKGMLKYLSAANKTGYVVQPLPVEQFSCRFVEKNKVELHWVPVADPKEPTANAEQYVLYTRVDDGDFDNGVLVTSNRITSTIQTGKIYSFKVTAVNKGGQSFPSEILSVYRAPLEKGEVIIVNGFDRVSAPGSFVMDSVCAGFYNDKDAGMPYMSDISFVGKQYEFNRTKPWVSDDAPGFGASNANYESTEVAGNTFDYPYLHGKAIRAAGYSFVSSSLKSVLRADVDLAQYKVVDLILGEQKQTFVGNAKNAPEFKTFPLALQQSIQRYCLKGGNLLVSGAHVGSDLYESTKPLKDDKQFAENVLKYKFRTLRASVGGNVKVVGSPYRQFKKADITYFDQPNRTSYFVGSPDAIDPIGEGSYTICRYAENNLSAGVAYSGIYKVCAFGFPLEALTSDKDRGRLMDSVLQFFSKK